MYLPIVSDDNELTYAFYMLFVSLTAVTRSTTHFNMPSETTEAVVQPEESRNDGKYQIFFFPCPVNNIDGAAESVESISPWHSKRQGGKKRLSREEPLRKYFCHCQLHSA